MRSILLILLLLVATNVFAFREEGIASWYGSKFHGRPTANGEIYNMHALTAAHPLLPFGTVVRVINLANGRQVDVRINDRGPFIDNRVIDLSYAAARALGMVEGGLTQVRILADPSVAVAMQYVSIQVGAFRNLRNAQTMRDHLRNNGFNAFAAMNSEGVIRIEIRGVPRAEADAYVERLRRVGIENPLVRR